VNDAVSVEEGELGGAIGGHGGIIEGGLTLTLSLSSESGVQAAAPTAEGVG
jgi:hypothetical protein